MNRRLLIVAVIAIILLGMALRAYTSFTMPYVGDGNNEVNLNVLLEVKEAVVNGYMPLPNYLSGAAPVIKAWMYVEPGQAYLILGFAWLLGGNYLLAPAVLKIIFDLASFALVYLFIKEITGKTSASLFGCLLWAITGTAVWAEGLNMWTGDTFMVVFLLAGLLAAIHALKTTGVKRYLFAVVSALLLVAGYFVWSGGPYILGAAAFAVLAVLIERRIGLAHAVIALIVLLSFVYLGAFQLPPSFGPRNYMGIVYSDLAVLSFANPSANLIAGWTYAPAHWLAALSQQPIFNYFGPKAIYNMAVDYGIWLPYLVWAVAGAMCSSVLVAFFFLRARRITKHAGIAAAVAALLVFAMPFIVGDTRWLSLAYLPVIILAGSAWPALAGWTRRFILTAAVCVAAMTLLILAIPSVPAYANPQIESTSLWIANHTPAGSTFLAQMDYGTPLEYWGNRTSYFDELQSNQPWYLANFSSFLFAKAPNFTYLRWLKPDYLISMESWHNDRTGITQADLAQEGGLAPRPVNGTNAWLLSQGQQQLTDGRTSLSLVYSENGIFIYQVVTR